MVRLAGFEPATYGLEVRCSIQLSYRRKQKSLIPKRFLIVHKKIGKLHFYHVHVKHFAFIEIMIMIHLIFIQTC